MEIRLKNLQITDLSQVNWLKKKIVLRKRSSNYGIRDQDGTYKCLGINEGTASKNEGKFIPLLRNVVKWSNTI